MTTADRLPALLADEELRHRLFPVTRQKVFLAHAAVSPLPSAVISAVGDYLTRAGRLGQFEHLHREAEQEARKLSAELLGAQVEEIAFASSTSAGLSMIAAGLPWKSGDEVVVAEGDFPANLYPWLSLQERGVRLRTLATSPSGRIDVAQVVALLSRRTRLVSLSSAHFATGTPLDVDLIGKALQERDILFCVDAIQTLGAMPCSIKYVDFLVADAHKWLLGPQGIAILYVDRRRFESLQPVLVGWKSVDCPGDFYSVQLKYADTARRYEPGSLNILGLVGLRASLALLSSFGSKPIEARLLHLRHLLLDGLARGGYRIAGVADVDSPTGIVTCRHPSMDMQKLYHQLDQGDLVLSLRQDLEGHPCLRIAPHFYNTEGEIERLLTAMRTG